MFYCGAVCCVVRVQVRRYQARSSQILLIPKPRSWFIILSSPLFFSSRRIARASFIFRFVVSVSRAMTVAFQCILWASSCAWRATAESSVCPVLAWHLCSLVRCFAVRAVSPMYTRGHSAQPSAYIAPGVSSAGSVSFARFIRDHFSVVGFIAVLMLNRVRIRLIASLTPWTYGIEAVVCALVCPRSASVFRTHLAEVTLLMKDCVYPFASRSSVIFSSSAVLVRSSAGLMISSCSTGSVRLIAWHCLGDLMRS